MRLGVSAAEPRPPEGRPEPFIPESRDQPARIISVHDVEPGQLESNSREVRDVELVGEPGPAID